MKRGILILSIIGGLATLTGQVRQTSPLYTDDVYYWPVVDTLMPTEPVYDKNAREFIFIEDTTQYPDTVVMRIVEK
jgi:hypothetical protein